VTVGAVRRVLGGLFLCVFGGSACSQSGGVGVPVSVVSRVPAVDVSARPWSPEIVRASAILSDVRTYYSQVNTWQATVVSEVYGPAVGAKDWTRSRVSFRRPGTIAAQVLEARDAKFVNTRLVYSGGDTLRLRTYFFGWIPLTLDFPVVDPRLLDAYKRSFKDTQTRQWFDVMLHPQVQAAWLGEGMSGSVVVDYLEVRSPASWSGVGREVFGIARHSHLPVVRDVYDARQRRMLHVELQGMRINPALDSQVFVL